MISFFIKKYKKLWIKKSNIEINLDKIYDEIEWSAYDSESLKKFLKSRTGDKYLRSIQMTLLENAFSNKQLTVHEDGIRCGIAHILFCTRELSGSNQGSPPEEETE